MPLVVPGLTSSSSANSKTDDWANKLMGKKLGDETNEITFAKQDLPKETRVLKGDSAFTMDHKPERMNVHVDDDGTVHKVTHG
ncbi:hypothetical protein EJ06DRAFT_555996 [Trichodelitschia bisporula]|uniref:Uncharacterized protein n=1 Tax=Trichodelitschia bisporula TaxID=703511 RepID=A0A6G1HZQ8_9PEZI|nr:hypothetical protein EJ06DRAFT_555996 [Trichodelitschia bisporula]